MQLGDKYGEALTTAAKKKSVALTLERMTKRIYSAIYLEATGTIDERKAKALTNEKYKEVEDEWLNAEREANLAQAHADACEVAFETWRTLEATKRAEMRL